MIGTTTCCRVPTPGRDTEKGGRVGENSEQREREGKGERENVK